MGLRVLSFEGSFEGFVSVPLRVPFRVRLRVPLRVRLRVPLRVHIQDSKVQGLGEGIGVDSEGTRMSASENQRVLRESSICRVGQNL